MKVCTECGVEKPLEEFYKNGIYRRPKCKECSDWAFTASKYGLTVDQLKLLYVSQQGMCAICGGQPLGSHRYLSVDHDHSCCPGVKSCGLCVRGLLCSKCNQGIGSLEDSPERLRKAADYLERTQALVQKRLGL